MSETTIPDCWTRFPEIFIRKRSIFALAVWIKAVLLDVSNRVPWREMVEEGMGLPNASVPLPDHRPAIEHSHSFLIPRKRAEKYNAESDGAGQAGNRAPVAPAGLPQILALALKLAPHWAAGSESRDS
jgi:hypothetical protein